MPFKSKAQQKACFARNDPNWDCHKWAKHTPDMKKLPEHVKKASWKLDRVSIVKTAAKSFDSNRVPVISTAKKQQRDTAPAVQDAILRRIGNVAKSKKAKPSGGSTKTASLQWNMDKTSATWG